MGHLHDNPSIHFLNQFSISGQRKKWRKIIYIYYKSWRLGLGFRARVKVITDDYLNVRGLTFAFLCFINWIIVFDTWFLWDSDQKCFSLWRIKQLSSFKKDGRVKKKEGKRGKYVKDTSSNWLLLYKIAYQTPLIYQQPDFLTRIHLQWQKDGGLLADLYPSMLLQLHH